MTELNRRHLLKVLSVSAAGTTAACNTQEPENILPYVVSDDEFIPGRPTLYATTCMECSEGCGLIARNVNGRLTTITGNSDDPKSKGGVCSRGHASIQSTYSEDRVTSSSIAGKATSASDVAAMIAKESGTKLIVSTTQSGSVGKLLESIDGVELLQYEATQPEGEIEVARTVTNGLPQYDLSKADLVVSLDAEFLSTYGNSIAYAKQLAVAKKSKKFRGLVHVSSLFTLGASNADNWVATKPNGVPAAALALASLIAAKKGSGDTYGNLLAGQDAAKLAADADVSLEKLKTVADALLAAKSPVVLCGTTSENGVIAHAATVAINDMLGAVGARVTYNTPVTLSKKSEVEAAMAKASVVVALDTDLRYIFGDSVKGKLVAVAATENDSTAKADAIVALRSHLESWNDVNADGITKLVQPTMAPLDKDLSYDSIELASFAVALAKALGSEVAATDAMSLVKQTFIETTGGSKQDWLDAVAKGAYSVESEEAATLELDWSSAPTYSAPSAGDLFVQVYASSRFADGRTADRPWLHELPDPLSTVVWDSWAEVHPLTVEKWSAKEGDTVTLTSKNGSISLPIVTHIGVRQDVIGVASGLGKTVGSFTKDVGQNAYKLLNGNGVGIVQVDAKVTKVAKPLIAKTQAVDTQDDRGIAQSVDVNGKDLDAPVSHVGTENMYPLHDHPEYRWGMSVNLDSCTGCGSCIVACDAENNIPMVGIQKDFPVLGQGSTAAGKNLLAAGREMHWMRIERYFEERNTENPDVRFVPAMCQQCTNAPCESVCPVYATMHTPDGVNAMVYNRCVGTRYCANNCPYKQRRLNWMTYDWPKPQLMQLNPEVTVRTKGVMEKCNFCYQRIRNATMDARIEKRKVQDGEIKVACQESCPADCIEFGDIQDATTTVSKSIEAAPNYQLLSDLNTRPAVSYLKKVKRQPLGG